MEKKFYTYLPDGISFRSEGATKLRTIYAPLSGVDAGSLKSSITPFLSGDIKIDKNRYLTKPVSTEDLRNDLRNFFVNVEGKGVFSLAHPSALDSSYVEVGCLWHKLVRSHQEAGLELEALNFIPSTGENVEVMRITVKNAGSKDLQITPTAVIPIFGRALANKHDHEHVTSLLHRTSQLKQGVLVAPPMLFNEEGHQENKNVYFVFGSSNGEYPVGSFPTIESFLGDDGIFVAPDAVVKNLSPEELSAEQLQGKESVGALRFAAKTLKPGDQQEYIIIAGIAGNAPEAGQWFDRFDTIEKFEQALEQTKSYWTGKARSIQFQTGDDDFNSWMQWVTIQPVLRRIFGCSFLPDHDYGKGGKGWRDLWQDLLSLILIEPENVRDSLINNFGGVRIDGSNATIIGSVPGEFIEDRNAITRVWMDHGAWPFLTILLYLNQTGDYDVLFEEKSYFRDSQLSRTLKKDFSWDPDQGQQLETEDGKVYQGTLLEHILVQNLVQFFNVGEHNITRLESADWNDGLDMAFERGESVAFMSFYGGNLLGIAQMLETLSKEKGLTQIRLAKEIKILLDTLGPELCDYSSAQGKKDVLFLKYFGSVQPQISGRQIDVKVEDVVRDLRQKAEWIFKQINEQEKVDTNIDQEVFTWINGYYDNQGQRVEGSFDGTIRMTLTGQVFPIMQGMLPRESIKELVHSVQKFLKDKKLSGYRLNTDFGLSSYLDLGRAFGFAYGTKENGAFFSHMTVMYAYALYKQGFAKEGYEVLDSIYQMSMATDQSKIYPGVPEYFDLTGKGMYHYLTGSASWLVLTKLTQVFGVRGEGGHLIIAPKLVKEEFSQEGQAEVRCQFAGKQLTVSYQNESRFDYGEYKIKSVTFNDEAVAYESVDANRVKIDREIIEKWPDQIILKVQLQKGGNGKL